MARGGTGARRPVNIVRVSVASPIEVEFEGKTTSTSIFKIPVDGAVIADCDNLQGDRQTGLSVHGGRDKAIYIYSAFFVPSHLSV